MPSSEATAIRNPRLDAMDDDSLLAATRELVRDASVLEADVLAHIAEIDERKLYRDGPFPSMFAFCVRELGLSEDVAYNRIAVARAGRRWPAVLEALRLGRIHLAGLRLLEPHLTDENHPKLLEQASGKSKREIRELVASISPRRPVATVIHRPSVTPDSADTFQIQFTGSRVLHDKLREAQDLLRHSIPDGDLATIIEKGLDLLIEKVKKKRFAIVGKPRKTVEQVNRKSQGRPVPAPIRRTVSKRAGNRCEFIDSKGRRCTETGRLEFHHVDGWARTGKHDVRRIRLFCRVHNGLEAERMYGCEFMERARKSKSKQRRVPASTRPGTGNRPRKGPAPP